MGNNLMPFSGNLRTTGMGILPHRDPKPALELALSLDIPFWPQLPKRDFYEDMYVQAAENFPGIILDIKERRIFLHTERFVTELEKALTNIEKDDFLRMSPRFSATYQDFLSRDLGKYISIRGQLEGPVSFGLNILDENKKPIIFNEEVRYLLFEFLARKANVQLKELKGKNANAFIFIDEPGLQSIFSSFSGYTDLMARADYDHFFTLIDHPRGIHLCGNPDWEFLLDLDIDILSFNAYNLGEVFVKYKGAIKRFLDRGGMLGWGLVPANYEELTKESKDRLATHLTSLFRELTEAGFDLNQLLSQSILMPATCALTNPDEAITVERTYLWLKELSSELRRHYLSIREGD